MKEKAKIGHLQNEFLVLTITREDVTDAGYRGEELDDDMMECIAGECRKLMERGVEFRGAVEYACYYWEIPHIEDEFVDDVCWEDCEEHPEHPASEPIDYSDWD